MKKYSSALLFLFVVACTSYDRAVMYHKNYIPGTNPFLKFDGSYSDTLALKRYSNGKKEPKPVIFFSNGSVYSFDYYISENCNSLPQGSWGNYLISGDSITIEKFQQFENNYDRITLKGIISENRIHLFSRQLRKQAVEPVDYWLLFSPGNKYGVDSTQNYTRIWPKYNH